MLWTAITITLDFGTAVQCDSYFGTPPPPGAASDPSRLLVPAGGAMSSQVPHTAETLKVLRVVDVFYAKSTTLRAQTLGKYTPRTTARSTLRMALPTRTNSTMAMAVLVMVRRAHLLT